MTSQDGSVAGVPTDAQVWVEVQHCRIESGERSDAACEVVVGSDAGDFSWGVWDDEETADREADRLRSMFGVVAAALSGVSAPPEPLTSAEVQQVVELLSVAMDRYGSRRHVAEGLIARLQGGVSSGGERAIKDQAELAVLRNLEATAREVRAFFGGNVGQWKLGGKVIADDVADPLLSLTDWLNHLEAIRSGVRGAVEAASASWGGGGGR